MADLIAEHPGLEAALGGAPSHWACYRFATKLRRERERLAGCIDALAASLREQYPHMGRAVAIDASDIPAYGNGQKYLYNGGPERKVYSDPDASWGHRSAVSTRKGGGFYGYRIHAAVCTVTGLPLAWQVETARSHESNYVAPLLDAARARGFGPVTCALDMGYDNARVYAECAERDVTAVIPLRRNSGIRESNLPRNSDEWRRLYRGRSAVEREFGRLKHHYGLAVLRVRGIERVRLHADLVILGRLALALARACPTPPKNSGRAITLCADRSPQV
ncbi:MAG: transposase [Actinobacteria bacterium]|nr:transposase [Actinomycetota bacterium]